MYKGVHQEMWLKEGVRIWGYMSSEQRAVSVEKRLEQRKRDLGLLGVGCGKVTRKFTVNKSFLVRFIMQIRVILGDQLSLEWFSSWCGRGRCLHKWKFMPCFQTGREGQRANNTAFSSKLFFGQSGTTWGHILRSSLVIFCFDFLSQHFTAQYYLHL